MPIREYIAEPHGGIGPLRFGMSRAQVRAALKTSPFPFQKGPQATHETDAFDEAGFHVYYKGTPEVVEFIEVFPVEGGCFKLHGIDVFDTPADEIIGRLRDRVKVRAEEDGCSFMLVGLDTALWRSDIEKLYFEALGVGEKGYYDE